VGNAIYLAGRRTEEPESLQEAYEAVRQRRGVAWIVLHKPTEEEFGSVAREFGLHPLPAEDPVKALSEASIRQNDEVKKRSAPGLPWPSSCRGGGRGGP
jgi:magnesium transporter